MKKSITRSLYQLMAVSLASVVFTHSAFAQAPASPEPLPLGFFITSVGLGDGGNLGGLAGADAHCNALATAVGVGERDWRAFLSTQGESSVNAIDRIGEGPWGNAKGVPVAVNIQGLLYDNSNLSHAYSLTENGDPNNSRAMGDDPNKHDVLTGTQLDGTAYPEGDDMTCMNWTSNSPDNKARVGHADRHAGVNPGSPWNSAHPSRGCSQENLQASGGDGLYYCFAAD